MKKNNFTLVILLSIGISVLVGCDNTVKIESKTQSEKSGMLAAKQELVRGNGTEIASLDPHKIEGIPEANILRDLVEGLVIQDAQGNTIAGAAESWETTDNKRFLFKIRPNAKWSNGEPLTAYDFEYSFKRVVNPNTASPYAWYMEKAEIKNARAIIAGKALVSSLGVTALDDKTLEITTEVPVPYFIKVLGGIVMTPVHKATVEKYGDAWAKPENYVGNGAYKLHQWVVNEKVELVRNPYYWDNQNTHIEKVTYLPIENQNAEMNRFFSGEIDITADLPSEQYQRLKQAYPKQVVTTPQLCTYYYGFNNKKVPFTDVRVRRALSYAIDRNVITGVLLGQGQLPAYALTHSGVTGFKLDLPEYAKMSQQARNEQANTLLIESGYSSDKPLNFTLLYNTNENHKKIAVAIQSMWKKAFGSMVNAKIENQEWKTYLDNLGQGNFDVARAGWCGDYNDASAFLAVGMTDNFNNKAAYSSAKFDQIMANSVNAKNEAQRFALYAKAEAELAKDMPIAPIYQYVKTRLISSKVAGFPYKNPQDRVYTKDLYMVDVQ